MALLGYKFYAMVNNQNPVYWTMRDGQKIDIDEMSLSHLRNTLKMIVRNNERRRMLSATFKLNGDIAQNFNEMQDDIDEENDF